MLSGDGHVRLLVHNPIMRRQAEAMLVDAGDTRPIDAGVWHDGIHSFDAAILFGPDNIMIGSIWLFGCEISYFVRQGYRRRGLGANALSKFCDNMRGVANFSFDYILAKIERDNVASKAVAERAGFIFCGLSNCSNILVYKRKFH